MLVGYLTQIDELGVTLPSEQKLAIVSSRVIFTQACALALAEPRLPSDLARSLIAQAQELLAAVPSSSAAATGVSAASAMVIDGAEENDKGDGSAKNTSSALCEALGVEITAAAGRLQALLDEAAIVTSKLDLSAGAEMVNMAGALEGLRALRVVTPEEELLEFMQVRLMCSFAPCCDEQAIVYFFTRNATTVFLRFFIHIWLFLFHSDHASLF